MCRWKQKADEFAELAEDKSRLKKVHPGVPPVHPEQEEELFFEFCHLRRNLGLAVDCYWFRHEFRKLIIRDKGQKAADSFNYSNGWVANFCRRWRITDQLKTEKKYMSPMERIQFLHDFHHDFHAMQCSMDQQSNIWGAYPPENIWNADHVPLPFTINLKRSMNLKGDDCWIAHVGPCGLDKRQASLHLCLRARGKQLMKPFIIFKGAGHIEAKEAAFYESLGNIGWAFQENAWADGKYSRRWAREFVSVVKGACPGNHCLLLDDLGAQKTNKFQQICIEGRVFPFPIPPGCTDLVQPVDHGVGGYVKHLMNALYKVELELNYDEWRDYKSNESLAAPRRRMMMALWLSKVWAHMELPEHSKIFKSSFDDTVLIDKAGKHSLKIPGIPNYRFPL